MKRTAAKLTSLLGVALVAAALVSGPAEARRGGSFGSRGMRTFQPTPATRTLPREIAPVQRTMTAPPRAAQPAPAAPATAGVPNPAQSRGGLFGGFGGGLIGGLAAGGLIGMLMGHGFGGLGAGLGNTLLQLAIVGLAAWMLMALFRRFRGTAAPAAGQEGYVRQATGFGDGGGPFGASRGFEPAPAPTPFRQEAPSSVDIGLIQADRDAFERLLGEIQDAFGREDYAALRARTTPEIMSYLSEELSQNAVQGRRNEVSGTRLLQADIAEAWREGDDDYATAAMRYEGVDVMRDRQSGAVVEGDPDRPTETTELWTFTRRDGGEWKLSAIQEA